MYLLLCRPKNWAFQNGLWNYTYYTGLTNDPHRRFMEHMRGRGGKYTASKDVTGMGIIQRGLTRSEALKMEARTKRKSHKQKEQLFWETVK